MKLDTTYWGHLSQPDTPVKEFWTRKKKNSRTNFKLTYEDELKLLKGVISSVIGKPKCLKNESELDK